MSTCCIDIFAISSRAERPKTSPRGIKKRKIVMCGRVGVCDPMTIENN
jgi:hypothetical protein